MERFEFAELLCGQTMAEDVSGKVGPYFTIQFLAFPMVGQAPGPAVPLPQVLVSPHQFRELLKAILAGLQRYFPDAGTSASDGGSSGTTPGLH